VAERQRIAGCRERWVDGDGADGPIARVSAAGYRPAHRDRTGRRLLSAGRAAHTVYRSIPERGLICACGQGSDCGGAEEHGVEDELVLAGCGDVDGRCLVRADGAGEVVEGVALVHAGEVGCAGRNAIADAAGEGDGYRAVSAAGRVEQAVDGGQAAGFVLHVADQIQGDGGTPVRREGDRRDRLNSAVAIGRDADQRETVCACAGGVGEAQDAHAVSGGGGVRAV